MATRLALEFYDTNSNVMQMSFPYAAQNATTANVKALCRGIITNGSIFARVPEDMKSAKLIISTETEYDLSD